jgi:hypothetical protein
MDIFVVMYRRNEMAKYLQLEETVCQLLHVIGF